ncbi:putative dynein ATPase [Helianthus anomalus]
MSEERMLPPADDRKTTTSSLTTSTSGSKKVGIKSADMNEEMQTDAVNIAISNVAELIKKQFDKNHGPMWHCIVGKKFGKKKKKMTG